MRLSSKPIKTTHLWPCNRASPAQCARRTINNHIGQHTSNGTNPRFGFLSHAHTTHTRISPSNVRPIRLDSVVRKSPLSHFRHSTCAYSRLYVRARSERKHLEFYHFKCANINYSSAATTHSPCACVRRERDGDCCACVQRKSINQPVLAMRERWHMDVRYTRVYVVCCTRSRADNWATLCDIVAYTTLFQTVRPVEIVCARDARCCFVWLLLL